MAKILRRLVTSVWGDCGPKALWQRILKDFIACVIATTIAILPQIRTWSSYLVPMVIAFSHPGQRMGVVIENIIMIIFGSGIGLSWNMLGLYLGSLVYDTNRAGAFTIRAFFYLACILLHGYIRSSSPRLFLFVLSLILPAVSVLNVPTEATPTLYTTIYVPILIGVGVILFVNVSIFPEFSGSYLGTSTISALSEMVDTLERATHWFVTPGGDRVESNTIGSLLGNPVTGDQGSKQQKPQIKRSQQLVIRYWHKLRAVLPNPFPSAQSSARAAKPPLHATTLAFLTERKPPIRTKLAACKKAQNEVNFEISISPLAPADMRPISVDLMSRLSQSVITLIGACENKFIVLDEDDMEDSGLATDDDEMWQSPKCLNTLDITTPSSSVPEANINHNLNSGTASRSRTDTSVAQSSRVDYIKLNRQIRLSSARLLESIVMRIRAPVQQFQVATNEAVLVLISCLAYCYDVPTLPSGARTPRGIRLEEIDLRIDIFTDALALFDEQCTEQLKLIAMQETGQSLDFMPRMESFLISSFLLAFRQSSTHILKMLRHARQLVEQRQRRHDRTRIWMPQYSSLRWWLRTTGELDSMVLPEGARKAARRGDLAGDNSPKAESKDPAGVLDREKQPRGGATDEEAGPTAVPQPEGVLTRRKTNRRKKGEDKEKRLKFKRNDKRVNCPDSWILKIRGTVANVFEWAQDSDDLFYALKLAFAVFLVSWPAFVPSWNAWYASVHGSWAPLQLIFIFEVAIGSSVVAFIIRLVGLVLGCTAGYVSFIIAGGSRAIIVVVLAFTLLPATYFHVATKYVKAGAAAIISMNVVAIASENVNTEQPQQVYYQRLVAFLAGGITAAFVELAVYPVRARDRLVESLSACVQHIQSMQGAMAVGVDGPQVLDVRSPKLHRSFDRWRDKAQASLAAAETFLPFCSSEPRLKGNFKKLAPIYAEIVYVLHQIIDRMDNVVQLRRAYGSSVLDTLNPQAYIYRRSMAASCTLMLFSVNEALTTWLPLPQFIPSARVAHLRLIHRVRDIITSQASTSAPVTPTVSHASHSSSASEYEDQANEKIARLITKHNFLSWNASAAGHMEIIEYLEELVELVKMLVGVNAFRSGMLEKPNYIHYVQMKDPQQESLTTAYSNASGSSSTAHQSSFAIQEEPEEMQDSVLDRSETAAVHPELSYQRSRRYTDNRPSRRKPSIYEAEAEEVPISLRRVNSRLWQGNEAARRGSQTHPNMR
ncbi:hypothetical protein HDV57DRAFT_436869 [Trichoderma longibrachiatum]|uniref:Integral membrane bound transporter domain-containing protein n=1 Tax=Trichoderma longibrachiatum ATCC 18648 TaxID=983965 RepID=A0A2T4CFL8_TRILO|nr:hypothetical protein M440DRAFT_1323841 [Trichoderma longibrachiatum ATCC 18648]